MIPLLRDVSIRGNLCKSSHGPLFFLFKKEPLNF